MINNSVSIIMPTYKCGRFIKESIKSVQSQTYQNWELIVVDDCSEDGTIGVVQDIQKEDDRIHVFSNAHNSGAAVSRNVALKEASEVEYWLDLLRDSEYIDLNTYNSIKNDSDEILKMLVAIVKTSKKNIDK